MATRRKHQKMLREKWGRERVLNERNELKPGWERTPTESERVEAKRKDLIENGQPTKMVHRYRKDEYEGIPNLNLRRLDGVVTHPVPEFTKTKDYPHQPLSNPSHLWCDEVYATNADVLSGNRSERDFARTKK